ncbi:hypothetical protein TNCV_431331 [Trichonephila clavipes]|nr:hypothetical protein TNCV_431331 [Trichonephila clavipes]
MDHIYTIFTPDRVVSRCQPDLGPSWPPDLSACDYFLWETLKSNVHFNNPQSLQEQQQNFFDEIPAVQLRSAFYNLLTRARRYQEMNGDSTSAISRLANYLLSFTVFLCTWNSVLRTAFICTTLIRTTYKLANIR